MPPISPPERFAGLLVERAQTWPIKGLIPPPPMSPWIAASLLQKAIRRGDVPPTQLAVSSLMMTDPTRFWRRLGVIAFEDIGLANLPLVGQVTIAQRGKTFRRGFGGEARVAMGLATDLARSAKNRAADDLLCVLTDHPMIAGLTQKLAAMSERQLLGVVAGCGDTTTRCVAADMFAVNCNSPLHKVAARLTYALGVAPSVSWLVIEGWTRTRTMLPLLVGLLTQENGLRQPNPDDQMPDEVEIAGIPGWALDMFTREGKAAIRRLMAGKSDVARYARVTFPYAGRTRLLGEAVFRVESGLLRNRLDGQKGQRLRSQMERECLGIEIEKADRLLKLMRDAIPELNACRIEIMEGQRND
ncbi:hypothetical protein [Aestuariivita sp.]|jgi:hypothetical protein|uniref:hypothetical protein n=1 Tax=Aestuariivita sp. TaxID=1872407 RepID=UPI00216BAF9C|nr:hypothetical protein [Aestuariivita sp.]MCE8006164.1 hypothetical protein [Aestuariivita sp.]